jgi:CelD/BcsL family acetyltransferase involved in cellulose biosynthesis
VYALVTGATDIAALMPELERVCLRRDAQLERRSQLLEPDAGPFFGRVVRDHAARGEVAITTLRLGGRMASYALCFVDRSSHRMWNSRFDPDFAQYGPGRLVLDATLRHALADPRIDELDWMRGEEGYKFSSATDVVPAQRVVAWSPSGVLGAELAARSAVAGLRAVRATVGATVASTGGRR